MSQPTRQRKVHREGKKKKKRRRIFPFNLFLGGRESGRRTKEVPTVEINRSARRKRQKQQPMEEK